MNSSSKVNEFPAEHLISIGQITVNFGDLEIFLMRSISQLISCDWFLAERLLGGDSFSILLTKFSKLFIYKVHDKELIKEFEKIITQLESVNTRRNRYTHSYWIIDEGKNITRVKLRKNVDRNKSIKEIENNIDTKAMNDFANEINKTKKELISFMKRVPKAKGTT